MTNNYTQLIEKEGKTFLFDPDRAAALEKSVDRLQTALSRIIPMLEENELPTDPETVKAVANDGGHALIEIDARLNEEFLKSMRVQQRRRAALVQRGRDQFDQELLRTANDINRDITSAAAEIIGFSDEDITFSNDGPTVNRERIAEKIFSLCSVEVSERHQAEAEKLKSVILAIRDLEDSGLNAIESIKGLVGNWLAPSKRPGLDKLSLYVSTMTHRHNSREFTKAANPSAYYLLGGE